MSSTDYLDVGGATPSAADFEFADRAANNAYTATRASTGSSGEARDAYDAAYSKALAARGFTRTPREVTEQDILECVAYESRNTSVSIADERAIAEQVAAFVDERVNARLAAAESAAAESARIATERIAAATQAVMDAVSNAVLLVDGPGTDVQVAHDAATAAAREAYDAVYEQFVTTGNTHEYANRIARSAARSAALVSTREAVAKAKQAVVTRDVELAALNAVLRIGPGNFSEVAITAAFDTALAAARGAYEAVYKNKISHEETHEYATESAQITARYVAGFAALNTARVVTASSTVAASAAAAGAALAAARSAASTAGGDAN